MIAGVLLGRMLRAIPGAGWVTLPVGGRGLLRRAIFLLLLLVLVGLLLEALTADGGGDRGWRGPGSCDEYPFASTYEGGPGRASITGVPLREQKLQGGDLLAFYRRNRIGNGDAFVVVVQ